MNDKEKDFLIAQVKSEESAGRLSAPFGPDLLLGMYSPPIHAVPKLQCKKHCSCTSSATFWDFWPHFSDLYIALNIKMSYFKGSWK